jgi:hypothetical protein
MMNFWASTEPDFTALDFITFQMIKGLLLRFLEDAFLMPMALDLVANSLLPL